LQTNDDIAFLKSIGIKSLIYIRNVSEIESHPDKFEAEKSFNVAIVSETPCDYHQLNKSAIIQKITQI
jgi:hypothetical protein